MHNKYINIFIVVGLILLSVFSYYYLPGNYSFDSGKERILIKNGAGINKDVYVPKKPERVVFLNPSTFLIWLKLANSESIVGVPIFPSVDKSVYENISSEITILPNFSSFSLEKILNLKPDLVVMNGKEKRFDLVDAFKQANVPLLTMPSRNLADIYHEINVIGQLSSNEKGASEEIMRIKNRIKENTYKYKHLPRKKVALIFGTSENFYVMTPYSRQGEMLELAGGTNVLSKDKVNIKENLIPFSLEYIAKENPDIIFFINRGSDEKMRIKIRESLAKSPAWQTMRAVKEERTYVLPQYVFSINPGLNVDYAIEYMSNILFQEYNL